MDGLRSASLGQTNPSAYANTYGNDAPKPLRQTDEAFSGIIAQLDRIICLVSRVEGVASRLGAPIKGEAINSKDAATQPDTLIWRLQLTTQTLGRIEARLGDAMNAIESVV